MWGLGTRTGVVSVRAEQSEPYFVMGLLVFNTWAEKQRPNLSTELLVFPHESAGFMGMYHAECSPPDFVFLAARKADKTRGTWVLGKTSLPTGVCLKAVGRSCLFWEVALSFLWKGKPLFSLWVAHMPQAGTDTFSTHMDFFTSIYKSKDSVP